MTGAFIRIQRDGKWDSIEIDQLTDEELEKFASDFALDGWKWGIFLAKWIRDNVSEK